MEVKQLIKRIAQNDTEAMVELANDLLLGEVKVACFEPIALLKRASLLGNEEARNLLAALEDSSEKSIQSEIVQGDDDQEPQVINEEKSNNDTSAKDEVPIEESEEEPDVLEEDDITEDVLLPYERKLLHARLLYQSGQEEQAYSEMEEGVNLCRDEDYSEGNNTLLQDTLVNLTAHYMDNHERYQYYLNLGVKAGAPVLQYTAGREMLLHDSNKQENVEEAIGLLNKVIDSGQQNIAVGARITLLSHYLAPNVKGFYRRNFKTIAQYFVDIFTMGPGDNDLMANILLGDFLSRMSKDDLTSLPNFAQKVGLPESKSPTALAVKAYKNTVKLASQRSDRNERALGVLAMQHIAELNIK